MMQRSWSKAMAGNTQLQRGGFTKTHTNALQVKEKQIILHIRCDSLQIIRTWI